MISQFSTPCTLAPFAGGSMVSGVRVLVELQVAWATAWVGKWAGAFIGRPLSLNDEGERMPAKWQQWMPLHIDRFLGSRTVQAMQLDVQMAYLRLIMDGWQSDDCTISSDPFDLAERSGLGDEKWAIHGPRILRKFIPVEGTDRLRNLISYEEWMGAKRIYDRRREAADRTNSTRSPSQNSTVTVPVTVEKGDGHRATYARVPARVFVPVEDVSVSVNLENGGELSAAHHLLEELNVVADNGVRRVAAEAIRLLAKEGGDIQTATDFILAAGKEAVAGGEIINRFWFTDQRYRPSQPTKSRKQRDKEARTKAFLEAGNEGD